MFIFYDPLMENIGHPKYDKSTKFILSFTTIFLLGGSPMLKR